MFYFAIKLLINEKENRAILTMNNKDIDEFVIINNDLHSSINVKTGEKKEDLFLRILYQKCNWHKNAFQKSIKNYGCERRYDKSLIFISLSLTVEHLPSIS